MLEKKIKSKDIYSEDSIQWKDGLEGVRSRPGMYLGERGEQMVFRCAKEIVDNALDEYMAERNNSIEFYADPPSNTYIIADGAEGIPIGINKKSELSTLTLVMTKLHAGGKSHDDGANSAYKHGSVGTHGVGVAAVNGVCSSLEVWTHRDGQLYHQAYKKGKPVTKVQKCERLPKDVLRLLTNKPKRGTVIRFVPDQTIVSVDKGKTPAKLRLKPTAAWLKTMALINANLKITFTALGKTKTFINTGGIGKMLEDMRTSMDLEPMAKPIILEDDALSMAIQWTTYTDDDGVRSYVSSSATRDGGTHLDDFYNALVAAILPYKGKRDKYSPKDIRNGLIGVLNYRMKSPEFSSQVKDRLTSNLKQDVYNRVFKCLTKAFRDNKSMVRKIVHRAVAAKKAKEDFKKIMTSISTMNQSRRGVMLPNILAMARNCKASERELFLVEGDSAAGCITNDTLVRLADGTSIDFKSLIDANVRGEIKQGLAFDTKNKKIVKASITFPHLTKYVSEITEIKTEKGTIKCTPDHKILTTRGWIEAQHLSRSDVIVSVAS